MDPGALGGTNGNCEQCLHADPKNGSIRIHKGCCLQIPDKFVRPTELLGHKYGVLFWGFFLSVNCLIINRRRNDLKLQIAACMLQTW